MYDMLKESKGKGGGVGFIFNLGMWKLGEREEGERMKRGKYELKGTQQEKERGGY